MYFKWAWLVLWSCPRFRVIDDNLWHGRLSISGWKDAAATQAIKWRFKEAGPGPGTGTGTGVGRVSGTVAWDSLEDWDFTTKSYSAIVRYHCVVLNSWSETAGHVHCPPRSVKCAWLMNYFVLRRIKTTPFSISPSSNSSPARWGRWYLGLHSTSISTSGSNCSEKANRDMDGKKKVWSLHSGNH